MRAFIFTILSFLSVCVLNAATVDDVRAMIAKGEFQEAAKTLEPMRKKTPKDGNLSFLYGEAMLGLGKINEAAAAYKAAGERGVTDGFSKIVKYAISNYDIDSAGDYIEDWRTALAKNKKEIPAEFNDLESKIIRMSNQIDRVEDIPVIARYDISAQEFNSAMSKMYNTDTPKGINFVGDGVPLFINNTNREIFFTVGNPTKESHLYLGGILDDGTVESKELTEFIGEGDIKNPFVMEDGETLYFAAKRKDSIGGYDIYMTRRDDEGGFYEPSNLGMPYNSLGNDLLFVIDESNNIGWWVTDRFLGPDTVSVMVFVPNATRKNISVDDPNLKSRALADNPSLTLSADFDREAAIRRIPKPLNKVTRGNGGNNFSLSLGNGRIVTSFSQFQNREAAHLMGQVLNNRKILENNLIKLEKLREKYSQGDKDVKDEILELETLTSRQEAELRNLTNRVISLETR